MVPVSLFVAIQPFWTRISFHFSPRFQRSRLWRFHCAHLYQKVSRRSINVYIPCSSNLRYICLSHILIHMNIYCVIINQLEVLQCIHHIRIPSRPGKYILIQCIFLYVWYIHKVYPLYITIHCIVIIFSTIHNSPSSGVNVR